MFSVAANASISNIILSNVTLTETDTNGNILQNQQYVGSLAGKITNSNISGIKAMNIVIKNPGSGTGGLISVIDSSIIQNIIVNVAIILSYGDDGIGGFAYQIGQSTLTNINVFTTMSYANPPSQFGSDLSVITGSVGYLMNSKYGGNSYVNIILPSLSQGYPGFSAYLFYPRYLSAFVGYSFNSNIQLMIDGVFTFGGIPFQTVFGGGNSLIGIAAGIENSNTWTVTNFV